MSTSTFRYGYLALCFILLCSTIGAIPGTPAPAEQVEAAELQATTLYLPLIAGSATSEQLIEQARAAGRITAETALTYRVFALFGDSRLPAQYKGDDSKAPESMAMQDLSAQFAQLSPSTQATLKPFLIPPFYAASWLGQPESATDATLASAPADQGANRCFAAKDDLDLPIGKDWSYIDSLKHPVRIWWEKDIPQHQRVAQQFATDIDTIWQALKTLLQKEPPSDEGATKLCRGGDNRLDITITDKLPADRAGQIIAFGRPATPSHLIISSRVDKTVLAHEVAHAFQYAFPIKAELAEYMWWYEATATWSEHYIYPDLNSEHQFALDLLRVPEQPLETSGNSHQYGAYLLPLFMQLSGYTDLMRASIAQFGQRENSLEAINIALPEGFEKQWPFFTQANWNADPITLYQTKDKLRSGPNLTAQANLKPNEQIPLSGTVPHLGARYYHYTISDPEVRNITFYNGLGFRLTKKPFNERQPNGDGPIAGQALMWEDIPEQDRRGLHMMAMLKINGQWQPQQDWTNAPYKNFCRDMSAERVEELVLIVSNSEWKDRSYEIKPQGEAPTIVTSNLGCYQWVGSTTRTEDQTGIHEIHTVTKAEQSVWQREPLAVQKDPSGASYLSFSSFVPVNGKIETWHTTTAPNQAGGTCSAKGEIHNVTPTPRDGAIILYSHALSVNKGDRLYFGLAYNQTPFTMKNTAGHCPDGEALAGIWLYVPYWVYKTAPASGALIAGTHIEGTVKTEWSLRARRQ